MANGNAPKPETEDFLIKTHAGDFQIKAPKGLSQEHVLALASAKNPQFAQVHAQIQANQQLKSTMNKAWQEQQERKMRLGAAEARAESSPTPMTTATTAGYLVPGLMEGIESGGLKAVLGNIGRRVKGAAKYSAAGAGTGGALGYATGGPEGAKRGAEVGAGAGALYGLYKSAPKELTVEEQAAQQVQKELALKTERMKAGLEPSNEDTIAEALRQEFLKVPKVSRIGGPGRAAGASTEMYEQATPAWQSQLRQGALDDIRKNTVNDPEWIKRLPSKQAMSQLTPTQQRILILQAIQNDPVALAATREGARIGSAGDLASWKQEDLWSAYMREYQAGSGQNKAYMDALKQEIQRRGAAQSHSGSTR